MEETMRQLTRGLRGEPEGEDDTPRGRAQALLAQAFATEDGPRRVRLAKEALALWPDCGDAYVLLAEHARSRKEALKLYEQGVAAAERALGPEIFREAAGRFWGLLETRPYMRAREGLALSLWTAGRRQEAVEHLQEMLRLNPGDNQGVRYTLAGFLLSLDRDEDLARLLAQYPGEGMATWAYTRALLAFRREGDTPEARRLLKAARKANKHVPAYLLGRKVPPAEQPGYYSPGDESEALSYVGSFLAVWKDTPGAVAWLRANEPRRKKSGAEPAGPRGPLPMVKKWLKEKLPQGEDVWQADYRQLRNWVGSEDGPIRPWAVLVVNRSRDLVLAHALPAEEPTAAALWDALVRAMQHPAVGEPHRPAQLQARPDERWESLRPHLEEIGVRLVVSEPLDRAAALLDELNEHLAGPPEPGLLDVPGVTPEQVDSFYAAAAAFFRQAPWKKVGYESALRVECGKFHGGPWYAVLMGQSGLTRGVALYEDLGTLRQMWAGEDSDEENARQTVATRVTFEEMWDIPVSDLEAAQRYGWEVARPDAYPSALHKERGFSMRPPLAWELGLLEGCLRAIPGFVERHRQDDPTREELTVPAASGELPLALSWVPEEEP
jgi:tetratricopeptide (TPR) repeat protein